MLDKWWKQTLFLPLQNPLQNTVSKSTPPSKPTKSKKQEREDLLFCLAEEKANCTGELKGAINFQLDQTAWCWNRLRHHLTWYTHYIRSWAASYWKENDHTVLGGNCKRTALPTMRGPHDLCEMNCLSVLFERLDALQVIYKLVRILAERLHTNCILTVLFPGKNHSSERRNFRK